MPRQVPFTEYEAALLLDAYLKTLSGEKERMESVRDCSLQLRQMALNAGSEIDDIYRNVNGISFQMASMESAYQGHTIMKPATRLFTEIVFLYRNDAARYRQLLKEAKGMASAKIDNEAVFMAWLAQNVSGIQLSELYLAFKEIEQQAKKVKIIRTSLYESLDPSTIKKVKAGVESSKIFKFTHKHQWGRITSALNYLLQFASQKATETQTQETARVEMVESVKELEIVPSPDISSNALLKENIKSTAVTHIETEQDMDQSGAATTVNFHRINSMAFSKPVSLSYFGEVKPESSWKGLYVDACKSLLDDYPDVFTRLKAESLHGSGKTWLVDAENLHLLAVPKQLEEGLFVETNRNASDLMKNLKWLLDECSVDYENVVITYTSKDEKKEASVPALVTTSAFQKKRYYRQDKEDFYHWLQDDQHILSKVYPALYQYLLPYRFGNALLDQYFQDYKYQKVINKILPEFVSQVEDQAEKREYNYILAPRTSVIESLNRKDAQLYFMDAMGVEYLGYILSVCRDLNLIASIKVCVSELPSITSRNKEFLELFADARYQTVPIKDIDDIKHHGKYDFDFYNNSKLPIHLIKELEVIRTVLEKIRNDLTESPLQRVFMIADHGASRLAVLHDTENVWEMAEKGQHSGRCCPKSDVDQKPDFAADAGDFWALANYDRFKGGRKANVEVHGGATLEELCVPIIELTYMSEKPEIALMPIDNEAFAIGDIPEIEVSFRKKAALKIFSTVRLQNVSFAVDGTFYPATDIGNNCYRVDMPELKKQGTYYADVCSGDNVIAEELPFVIKKEGQKERSLL